MPSSALRDRRLRRPLRSRLVGAGTALAVAATLVACGAPPAIELGGTPTTTATPTPSSTPLPAPDAEIVALADRMSLTAEGRSVFYASRPRLADAEEIATECAGIGDAGSDDRFTGGCFIGSASTHLDADRIFVFRPADDRLAESMVTVAAHELLHAVYARLDPGERAQVDALAAEAIALVPADDQVHEQIAWSVGDGEANRANEQFAYLGAQVALDGGLPELLEEVYALFFTDRAALVDTHRRASAVIDDALAAAEAAWAEAAALESQDAQARAQLAADLRGYHAAAAAYADDLARFEATPPAEQARWEVTLRPVGGEPITLPWGESLQHRWAELERFRGELESRGSALDGAEATAAAARSSAEALRADATALVRAANPAVTSDDWPSLPSPASR